jgi:dipeptidase D
MTKFRSNGKYRFKDVRNYQPRKSIFTDYCTGLKYVCRFTRLNDMTNNLENLQPHSVWAHFATLCAIPRASHHEAALREHLIQWAHARGVAAVVDDVGNLILKKPASPGYEAMPGVILQGHLDMVCQTNTGTAHDFLRDPIRVAVLDGWVVAKDTTLGADNGIGVALALAALEEPNLIHPPLEVLLTINEESGMDGARGLAPGTLLGKTLINLDTEEWGHFYLGCAGGVDVEVSHTCIQEDIPQGYTILRFDVSGLRGGHSGIDIHLGRGNAIKLLAEALRDLSAHTDMRLIELNGGTARNAIPREAFAVCALPSAAALNINEWVQHGHDAWRERYKQVDGGITFSEHFISEAEVAGASLTLSPSPRGREKPSHLVMSRAISAVERDRLLTFLDVAVNGVAQISDTFEGVVDTSDNLGVVSLTQGVFRATFKMRSLHNNRRDALADKLVSLAAIYDLHAWTDGAYPGWTPNPSSALLALSQKVYIAQFGQPASLQVIHAGLECGLLAASHPHLDMISFGPDIRGAHAPGESVQIESVAHCWQLLKALLNALATDA